MDIDQIEKLRVLIHSDDIENVQMGLELCDVLLFEETDLAVLFGLEGVSDTEGLSLSQDNHVHGRHLYGWILCKLLELECAWVKVLTELDLSGCGLRDIPYVVLQHSILEGLDLSFNALEGLPDLSGLKILRWVSLFGNPLDMKAVLPQLEDFGLDKERCVLSLSDVSGGRFMMGALPSDGEAGGNEKPRHEVVISESMLVMRVPVIQWLYERVMGNNPSHFQGGDRPVEQVSWYDAVTFANALSALFGLSPAYTIDGSDVICDWSSDGWRLPTEAEWEYLARGGEEHLYAGSDDVDSVAWYDGNSGDETHPVGQKQGNGFGLYDMSGNVLEWCWDGFGGYSSGSVTDPRGPSSGSNRVSRGGCWLSNAGGARASFRSSIVPSNRYSDLGFRLLRKKIDPPRTPLDSLGSPWTKGFE